MGDLDASAFAELADIAMRLGLPREGDVLLSAAYGRLDGADALNGGAAIRTVCDAYLADGGNAQLTAPQIALLKSLFSNKPRHKK